MNVRHFVIALAAASCANPVEVLKGGTGQPADAGVILGGSGGGNTGGTGGNGGGFTGNGNKGALGCPTVDYPTTATASAALSPDFAKRCGTCHGTSGQGTALYPRLPGTKGVDGFIAAVRNGSPDKGMPAFDAATVSDSTLKADYAALQSGVAVENGSSRHPSFSWTTADIDQRYRDGMVAWRKPDPAGAACANCHSPDAIDLALLGFPDEAILRRTAAHLPPADAEKLVDLVHAQRQRYKIERPCDPLWRPLQPGGEPLPGNTPDEQDAAFLGELKRLNLFVATGKVVTLDDAKRARDEITGINLRTLRIGIPLPRWTEDGFRGAAHKSIDDHMPAVPHAPKDAAWYAKNDAYLSNPTDAAMLDLVNSVEGMTNDRGFLASTPVINACGAERAGFFISDVADAKYRGVLIISHLMRMALKSQSTWPDLPLAPFPDNAKPLNPFFFIGGQNAERICPYPYDADSRPAVAKALPKMASSELSAEDIRTNDFLSLSRAMAHHWMTLGQIYDQTLFQSEGQPNNKLQYWVSDNTFLQRDVHAPFYYVHRVLVQQAYRKIPALIAKTPKAGDWYRQGIALPLLDGARMNLHTNGPSGAVSLDKPYAEGANRLKGNLYRMLLLLQKEELQQGASVSQIAASDHGQNLLEQIDAIGDQAKTLVQWRNGSEAAKLGTMGGDLDLYSTQTVTLVQEVKDLVRKAKVVDDQ